MERFTMSGKEAPRAGLRCRRPSPTDLRPAGNDRAAPLGGPGPTPREVLPPRRGSRAGAESHRPADASHPMRGDCMDRREGGSGPVAAPPLRVYRRRSIEVGYVGGQVLDILLREDLR